MSFGGCEVSKKAVEVEQVKVTHNISYAEAVRGFRGVEMVQEKIRQGYPGSC